MPFEFAFIMKRTTCYLNNKYKKVELFYNIFSIEDKGEHLLCIFTLICSHFDHFWSIYATSLVALPVIYHTRAPVLFPSLTSDLSVKEIILMYLEPHCLKAILLQITQKNMYFCIYLYFQHSNILCCIWGFYFMLKTSEDICEGLNVAVIYNYHMLK